MIWQLFELSSTEWKELHVPLGLRTTIRRLEKERHDEETAVTTER